MDRIVAVSDTVNAGIHALAIAEANGGSISAREAAERLKVSPSYLAKIMQKLAVKGLLVPTRGLGGGYALAKPATQISCLEVLKVLEGDLPRRECLFTKAICRTGRCALQAFCEDTEKRLHKVLETTTIAAIARSF